MKYISKESFKNPYLVNFDNYKICLFLIAYISRKLNSFTFLSKRSYFMAKKNTLLFDPLLW